MRQATRLTRPWRTRRPCPPRGRPRTRGCSRTPSGRPVLLRPRRRTHHPGRQPDGGQAHAGLRGERGRQELGPVGRGGPSAARAGGPGRPPHRRPRLITAAFPTSGPGPAARLLDRVGQETPRCSRRLAPREPASVRGPGRDARRPGRPAGTEVLVILDQFEEYFLYHRDEDGSGQLAAEFPPAVDRADLPVSFWSPSARTRWPGSTASRAASPTCSRTTCASVT